MNKPAQPPRSLIYALLFHPSESRIRLDPSPTGWTLPRIPFTENLWIRIKGNHNKALQDTLGPSVTALFCADYQKNPQTGHEEIVYVLENHGHTAALPTGSRWVDRKQLEKLTLALPHHKPIIEATLTELGNAIPALRSPWSRPGWFGDASNWMETELAALNYRLIGPVEHANHWCLSCILRAPTSKGDVYLKAGPDFPLFVNEPVVVAGLAPLFPYNIPTPISIDAAQRWMLLGDFGPPLARNSSSEARIKMLQQFADIQQQTAKQVSQLLELGCIDRRLHRLAAQMDSLLADPAVANELGDANLARFQVSAPELKEMCLQLAEMGIPETLNHGDLHLGNVASRDGHLLFFDWTDACIAHPFMDMISIFEEEDAGLRVQLRDAYLALWTDYAPRARLNQAWTIAERLSALHQAISYQSILQHIEEPAKKGFGNVVSYYVRRALANDREHAADSGELP